MKRIMLLGMFIAMAFGCFGSVSSEEMFRSVWEGAIPKTLKITRVVGDAGSAFAVFADVSRSDFELFRKTSSQFTDWNPVADGMVFEVGKTELQAPREIRGIYSIGSHGGGLAKVIVWDEQTQKVVVMLSSGVM